MSSGRPPLTYVYTRDRLSKSTATCGNIGTALAELPSGDEGEKDLPHRTPKLYSFHKQLFSATSEKMYECVTLNRETLPSSAMQQQSKTVFVIRLLIAVLLLSTAILKVLYSADAAAMAIAYRLPPLLNVAVVQAELALAALLLFGCWPTRALIAAAVMFALFGAFSSYRGWAGYESCGCFGLVKVNPWITAALDGGVLLLAVWGAWKSSGERRYELKRFYYASSAYAVAGLLAVVGMIANAPLSLGDLAFFDVEGLIVLEPETWIGKPFPLGAHLVPEVPLHEGCWTLLLYHHDCPQCQTAVPQYEWLALAGNDCRIVLVETPPYGDIALTEGEAIRTRLSDDREWFVQTPIEIQVDAGIVVSASLDLPAISVEPSLVSKQDSDSTLSSSLLTN